MTKKQQQQHAKQCAYCDRPHTASTITPTAIVRRCTGCFAAYYKAKA